MAPKSKNNNNNNNNNHDEAKSETASVKNGHTGSNNPRSSSKLQRVASSAGTHAKDTTTSVNGTASGQATAAMIAGPQQNNAQGQQRNSPERERDFLHEYRREFRLDTPPSFSEPYHHWVLSQSKIGMQSPTMARRSVYRRQSRDDLAKTVRKHINSQGMQENDVIVAFLHRVRNPGVVRPRRDKNLPHSLPFP